MAFLNHIDPEPSAPSFPVLSVTCWLELHHRKFEVTRLRKSYQLESDWYCHWTVNEVRSHAKFPLAMLLKPTPLN